MSTEVMDDPAKPLLRGHFHQAAFFLALGACAMLIAQSQGLTALWSSIIYSSGLVGLLGISALYHRPMWRHEIRVRMKRLDHSAIYVLIAATFTPMCLLALSPGLGRTLLTIIWTAAAVGVVKCLFWINAPKWLSVLLYLGMGWLAAPYVPHLYQALGALDVALILSGGVIYTVGALVYAARWPDPAPRVFGYHEILHVMVVIAAVLHFIVIYRLVS